ncbi:kinase-like domain-containing protein [Mycena amicta]|nr:kinase-like domain-containing protein [Mycena amicta]
MKIELTAVDVVNNDELKCWTVTGDGRGGVMDGDGDGRCLKWPKGPNGDPQLAGVWEPTSSPSSKKGRIGCVVQGDLEVTRMTEQEEVKNSRRPSPQLYLRRTASRSSFGGFSSAGTSEESDSSQRPNSGSEPHSPGVGFEEQQQILQQLEVDLTGQILKPEPYPFDTGGTADIYQGTSTRFNLVAIRIFRRFYSESQEAEKKSQALYTAAHQWKDLNHPNILKCFGIALHLGPSPALITAFCPSGSVLKYLSTNSQTQEQKLKMIGEIADGIQYLHSQGIIHGSLSTKKILIDNQDRPVISGYGMFEILGSSPSSTSMFSTPIRYSAPEYFSDELGIRLTQTMAGDVYGLGMVILEVTSFNDECGQTAETHFTYTHISQASQDSEDMSDWMDAVSTADSQEGQQGACKFSDHLSTVLRGLQTKQSSSGEETTFDDPALVEFHSRDLTGRITRDGHYPFAGGGNANIYLGKLARSNGSKIRVAIIEMSPLSLLMCYDGSGQPEEIIRRMKREVEVWSHLQHKNILPFIGVCNDLPGAPWPVLISPYHKLGNVGRYIRKHPEANRQELVLGVACGLQFLHEKNVVHGDLKAQNVLVNKHGIPCICDFGISKIVSRRGFTTSNVGTAPYMAPELFYLVDGPIGSLAPQTTTNSDVYSFALLVLEILTAEPPKGRPHKPILTSKIVAQLHPKREDYHEKLVADQTWAELVPCWASDPNIRPVIAQVHRNLRDCF